MDGEMKGLRTDWQALRVAPEATVHQAMQIIDSSRLGIALVADASGRLLDNWVTGLRRGRDRDREQTGDPGERKNVAQEH